MPAIRFAMRGRRGQTVDLPLSRLGIRPGREAARARALLAHRSVAPANGAYPVSIHNGLIFVDPSGKAEATEFGADIDARLAAAARVTRRARYGTTWNWKFLRNFLRSSPHLFFDGSPDAASISVPSAFCSCNLNGLCCCA